MPASPSVYAKIEKSRNERSHSALTTSRHRDDISSRHDTQQTPLAPARRLASISEDNRPSLLFKIHQKGDFKEMILSDPF